MRRRQEEGRKDARGPQKEEGGEREKSQGSYRKPQEVTGSHRKSQEVTCLQNGHVKLGDGIA